MQEAYRRTGHKFKLDIPLSLAYRCKVIDLEDTERWARREGMAGNESMEQFLTRRYGATCCEIIKNLLIPQAE